MKKDLLIGFLAGAAVGAFGGILFTKKKGWKKKKGLSDGAPQMDSSKNKDRAQSARSTVKDEVRSALS
jgi:gas vesicle protein